MKITQYEVITYGIVSKTGYINPVHYFHTYYDAYYFCCQVNRDQGNESEWVPVEVRKFVNPHNLLFKTYEV